MIRSELRHLIFNWLFGAVVGTAIIAFTSPWFVRSYLPREVDAIRGVRTMPTGVTYRWRSEGWADTKIGPLGMPGKLQIDDVKSGISRIALWGDSQAEGVTVADQQKLFAQIERLSNQQLQVFPFARSGDDLEVWLRQIPAVERKLQIDMHVVLVVDLPDLLINPSNDGPATYPAAITALPAFLIQASRNLITDHRTGSIRKLRFAVGPENDSGKVATTDQRPVSDWGQSLTRLRAATDHKIVLLYAPPVPQIVGDRVQRADLAATDISRVEKIANGLGIQVVNVQQALVASAQAGHWPHGFHNGRIGVGHLNSVGYEVIATMLIEAIVKR